MPIQTVPYPLINGNYFDFSSVEMSVPGMPPSPPYGGVLALQEISYDDQLEAGYLRGAAPHVLARTRGKYTASGKMKLPKVEAQNIIDVMSQAGQSLPRPMGYLEYGALTITVQYFEASMGVLLTDTLIGFRFKKNADNHKVSQDPLMVDLDFDLFMLVRNNLYPFDPANLKAIFGLPNLP